MGDAQIVLSAVGFFIITGALLGISGLTSASIELPEAPGTQDSEVGNEQGFGWAVVECAITLFSDCSRKTETKFVSTITDLVAFGVSAGTFLFQLLTFQIPEIPIWLSAIIVLPPAAALGYVGLKFIRGLSG